MPLWPVAWVSHPSTGIVLLVTNLAFAMLAAWHPANRILRVFAAASLLERIAYISSFAPIGHGMHFVLWTSIIFCFLPHGNSGESRMHRQKYLFVFWTTQCTLLLFYSLSGGFKIVGAVYQLVVGQPSAFDFDALSRHIAHQALVYSSGSILGDQLFELRFIGWLMFVSAILLEACSFPVAFRPAFHRFWGMSLIGMHIGIGLAMNVWFVYQILVVGLLLVNSPFIDANPRLTGSSLVGASSGNRPGFG